MPIPTRSQSVRAPTAQTKSQLSEHNRGLQDQSTGATAVGSRTGTSAVSASRIPGLEKRSAANLGSSHARSQSSSTIGIPRPAAFNKTSRVPTSSTTATTATPTVVHTRSQSVATSKPVPTTQIQRLQPTPQSLARTSSQSSKPPSKIKPSSNIYQQHPGPLRNAHSLKPGPDNTGLALSQPLTNARSPASSRLEDELLQLAAVYEDSHASLQQFELSVCHKLEASESALRAEEDAVRISEKQRQTDVNAEALWNWLHNGEDAPSRRKLQDLSFCVSELSDLNTSAGLFNTCMRDFEAWLRQAQDVLQQRTPPGTVRLVEPVDPLWAHNVHELEARLGVCEHLLHQLHDQGSEDVSALAFALCALQRLTKTMKESLAESQRISEAVLSTQRDWVTNTISTIVRTNDDGGDVTSRRGVWS